MRRRRRRIAVVGSFLVLAVAADSARAAISTLETTRVSVDASGGDPDGTSFAPSVSATGRYVAFASNASDLVPGDANGTTDVFVRDVLAGVTTRVSVEMAGDGSGGGGTRPSISADGMLVAFFSASSDLVEGDTNGLFDVFVHDLATSTTSLVSVDATGGSADGPSYFPGMSANGRFVGFVSEATDLVANDGNGYRDVFVRDLLAGATTRISVDMSGGDGDDDSGGFAPSLSSNGRFVAFDAVASDLVRGDGNGVQDVFVRDVIAGTTVRVSVDTAGGDAAELSNEASISADGGHVAFTSLANDLVPDDTSNFQGDVFVRNIGAGTTQRVSVDAAGSDADGTSDAPDLSADGRYVAFSSTANDLAPPAGPERRRSEVFVRDLAAGVTTMVSVDRTGANPNPASEAPSISATGRYVAFRSGAPRLVAGDRNRLADVFLTALG